MTTDVLNALVATPALVLADGLDLVEHSNSTDQIRRLAALSVLVASLEALSEERNESAWNKQVEAVFSTGNMVPVEPIDHLGSLVRDAVSKAETL
jgi:hypothetical protein